MKGISNWLIATKLYTDAMDEEEKKKIFDIYCSIAGEDTIKLIDISKGFNKKNNYQNEEVSAKYLMDAMILLPGASDFSFLFNRRSVLAAKVFNKDRLFSKEPEKTQEYMLQVFAELVGEVEEEESEDLPEGLPDDLLEEEGPEEALPENEEHEDLPEGLPDDLLNDSSEDLPKGSPEGLSEGLPDDLLEDSPEDSNKDKSDVGTSGSKKEEIYKFFKGVIEGNISSLIKRYSALFESGYDLERPAGFLVPPGFFSPEASAGMLKVVGGKAELRNDSAGTAGAYEVISSKIKGRFLGYSNLRANADIAADAYNAYKNQGGSYRSYPYKLLEYAYGMEKVTGDNVASRNTYGNHAKQNNWSAYVKEEVMPSVQVLFKNAVYVYVSSEYGEGNEWRQNTSVRQDIEKFLAYLVDAMSNCVLVTDYQEADDVAINIKIRICDPSDSLLKVDLTQDIAHSYASINDLGKNPMSATPSINQELHIVEYSHEFNRSIVQSTPLFAYKALDVLQQRGETISWDSVILGRNIDGSILRTVKASEAKGGKISFQSRYVHFICAASRAGKGVMTLNVLASALASRKPVVYLDCKPDMATLFKYLTKGKGFVVNGYYDGPKDCVGKNVQGLMHPDNYRQYYEGKVPEYFYDLFKNVSSRNDLDKNIGVMAYVRALVLWSGIIKARGDNVNNEAVLNDLGGKSGFVIIADEYSLLQNKFYQEFFSKIQSSIPPLKLSECRRRLESGKMEESKFNEYFNDANYYALALLMSYIENFEYFESKKLIKASQTEINAIDIFCIGQHFDWDYYHEGDKKGDEWRIQESRTGIQGGSFYQGNKSFLMSLLDFQSADCFIGKNEGNYDYLHTVSANSEHGSGMARGKLDETARNFAYLSIFDAGTREAMVKNTTKNGELEKSAKYFKPFLLLNTNSVTDTYGEELVSFVEKAAFIPREEFVRMNCDPSNPNDLHPGVGMEGYLAMAGVTDIDAICAQAVTIAETVIQNYMGYQGSYLDFLYDMRVEWLFTVEDVCNAITNGTLGGLRNPEDKRFREWKNFNPDLFNYMGVASDGTPTEFGDRMKEAYGTRGEDYTDPSNQSSLFNARMQEVFNGTSKFDEDDLDLKSEEEEREDLRKDNDSIDPNRDSYNHSKPEEFRRAEIQNNQSEIESLLRRLQELGVNFQTVEKPLSATVNWNAETGGVEPAGETKRVNNRSEINTLNATFSTDDFNTPMWTISEIITKDILKKFGGVEMITKIGVQGNSLKVNGYWYRCKLLEGNDDNIPFGIKAMINSGNIAELVDWDLLCSNLPNVRIMEFDSWDFVCDFVLNTRSEEDTVDRMFNLFPTLRALVVEGVTLTYDNYRRIKEEEQFKGYTSRRDKIVEFRNAHWGERKDWERYGSSKEMWRDPTIPRREKFKRWIHSRAVMTKETALAGAGVVAGAGNYVADRGARKVKDSRLIKNVKKGLKDLFS